ncbi:MAG: hypothetical protein ACXWUG_25030 [Polyangiales bacterium]
MRGFAMLAAGALVAAVFGCGGGGADGGPDADSGASPDADECGVSAVPAPDGGCVVPGVPAAACMTGFESDGAGGCTPILPASPCADGTFAVPGQTTCRAVGVADCAPGFVADPPGGCKPALPPASCPGGEMAVPGDAACRDVAPCGKAPYGDETFDANTLYVDASYALADSDGSFAKPFVTLKAALLAAKTSTTTVAIAAGSYTDDVIIDKPLRVVGRCPSMVELKGASASGHVARITANGASLERVAITAVASGVQVEGSAVTLSKLWVHDIADGVDVLGDVTLSDSLLEKTALGVYVVGKAKVERTVLRDNGDTYAALQAQPNAAGVVSELTVNGSVLERSAAFVYASGARVTLHATVTRLPTAASTYGIGVTDDAKSKAVGSLDVDHCVMSGGPIGILCQGTPLSVADTTLGVMGELIHAEHGSASPAAEVHIARSRFASFTDTAITLYGNKALIEDTLVRDGYPSGPTAGRGIYAQADGSSGELTVRGSLFERCAQTGVFAIGLTASIESSSVRKTKRAAGAFVYGEGLDVEVLPTTKTPGTMTVKGSLIEGNYKGITATSSALRVIGSVVRDNVPPDDGGGWGIVVESSEDVPLPGSAEVSGCVVSGNAGLGFGTFNSKASIDATVVRDTRPESGKYGVGVVAMNLAPDVGPTTLDVTRSLVVGSATGGIAFLGASGTVSTSLVIDTKTGPDGKFGDGISATVYPLTDLGVAGSATIVSSIIRGSSRAGASAFGASLSVRDSRILCGSFDLDFEPVTAGAKSFSPDLRDEGGVVCACDAPPDTCHAQSAGLEPVPAPAPR